MPDDRWPQRSENMIPAQDAEKVRTVHRFQCVCPCGWESEELFDLIGDAAWRLEKHEAGACPLPLHIDGQVER